MGPRTSRQLVAGELIPKWLISIWLVGHPSEQYEFVNWDDEIPNIWENKKWQPNHQPEECVVIGIWCEY